MLKQNSLIPMNLQMFAEGDPEPPTFTLEDFKSFAESNEDAKKFLQSQNQSAADTQLQNWQKNNLDKIKQDAIKQYEESKKHKTPEQQRIEALEKQFQESENKRLLAENQSIVATSVTGLELNSELKTTLTEAMMKLCVSTDADQTNENIELMTGFISAMNEDFQKQLTDQQMTQTFGNNKKQQQQQTQTEDPMQALGQALDQLNQ